MGYIGKPLSNFGHTRTSLQTRIVEYCLIDKMNNLASIIAIYILYGCFLLCSGKMVNNAFSYFV